jgi:hypothetical protein
MANKNLAESGPTPADTTANTAANSALPENTLIDPRRERKQFTIFLAGCGFSLLSAMITRRAVVRRMNWAKPTYFRQNNMHPEQKVDASLEAMEALSVATVNVFSWGIFFVGGAMWATDTSGINEVRTKLRVRLGLKEEEQKGSQKQVGEWLEAAKFWKSGKGQIEEPKDPKSPESPESSSNSSSNEPGS